MSEGSRSQVSMMDINSKGEQYGEEEDEEDGEGVGEHGEKDSGEVLVCTFEGCNKEFFSKWSLTRHIRTHTGERPFKCSLCGKEFVQKCSLKRHEQTHSQAKQWICDHIGCGKRFKLKDYLEVHKKTHIAENAVAKRGQDSADSASALIDQLRQRLVRMSVRHHEQLKSHQEREQNMIQSLLKCASALEMSVNFIASNFGSDMVPDEFVQTTRKFSEVADGYPLDRDTQCL